MLRVLLTHHIKMQSDGTHHRNGSGKVAVVELCPEQIYDE